MNLSKSVVLALIVVAGLAAGTALVAGYADKPSAPAQVACPDKCDDCPLQGTDACGKTQPSGDGACCAQVRAKCCPSEACEEQSAGGYPQEVPPACCPMSGGGCGMGPCAK